MSKILFIFRFILFGSFTSLVISQNSSLNQLNQTNFTDSSDKVFIYEEPYRKNVFDCYLQTSQTNSTWRLVWEEQFDDDSSLSPNMTFNWNIQNETTECTGNGLKPVTNCNLAKNVFQSHGLLVLMSKYEKYKDYNFTGSTVTTAGHFNYGRFEIRAAQPVGDEIRTRIITRNTMESFWPEFGQINIGSNTMDTVLYRDVLSKKFYEPADLSLFDIEEHEDLHAFHVYGMEWSDKEVVFFFDQTYGTPIKFNASIGLQPLHQIQLQMGVGGRDFDRPEGLDHFEDLNWECPAFLIDYIRVYEKVAEIPENSELCEDLFDSSNSTINNATYKGPSKEAVQHLCRIALEGNILPLWTRISKNWRYLIIGVGIILVSFLVIYLIYLVVKMKRKMARDPFGLFDSSKSNQSNPNGELYETYIYDKVYEHDPLKSTSYLNLYEAGNKTVDHESAYVPITGSIENILDDGQQQYGGQDTYGGGNRLMNKYVSIKRAKSDSQVYQNSEIKKDEKPDQKKLEDEIKDVKEPTEDNKEPIKALNEDKYEPLCRFVGKFVQHKKETEKVKVSKDEKHNEIKYIDNEEKNCKEFIDGQEPINEGKESTKDNKESIKDRKFDKYEPLCRFVGKFVSHKKGIENVKKNKDKKDEENKYEDIKVKNCEIPKYNKEPIKVSETPIKDDQEPIKSLQEDKYEPLCKFVGKFPPNKKETNNEEESEEDKKYEKLVV